MPEISASAVASLRARTGVSILHCKKALEEASGDEEKAIEILRKKGLSEVAKKAGRDQSEGIVFIAEDDGAAALVTLRCETDFVAREDAFKHTGMALAAALLKEGESATKAKAETDIAALVQKLGENITLGETQIVKAPVIGTYTHTNGKIGVVIGLEGGSRDQARDVAMHAAAMNPRYTRPDDVPEEEVKKEKEIWTEQMKNEKKPPEILEKIMLGKEKKFREENALIKQAFAKDSSKTVEQFLGSAKVAQYLRVQVG